MPALSSPILSSRNLPSRLIQIKQKNLRKRTEAQRAEVPPSRKDMLEQYFEAMSAPGSVRMPSLYWDVFRKNIKAAIDRSGLLITNEYAKAVVSKMPRSECEHINLNSIDMSKLCEVVDFGMQMEAGQDQVQLGLFLTECLQLIDGITEDPMAPPIESVKLFLEEQCGRHS